MVITVKLPDGSEQTLNVEQVRTSLTFPTNGGRSIEPA